MDNFFKSLLGIIAVGCLGILGFFAIVLGLITAIIHFIISIISLLSNLYSNLYSNLF